jgi:hypothetical protein
VAGDVRHIHFHAAARPLDFSRHRRSHFRAIDIPPNALQRFEIRQLIQNLNWAKVSRVPDFIAACEVSENGRVQKTVRVRKQSNAQSSSLTLVRHGGSKSLPRKAPCAPALPLVYLRVVANVRPSLDMAFAQRAPKISDPIPIDRKAADNLRFIRDTMERAGSFTAVPGWGGVLIGSTAMAAGALAQGRTPELQFRIWLIESVVALLAGFITVQVKSRRLSQSLQSSPARRALLSFAAPLLAGAALTAYLFQHAMLPVLPGLWLLLYGTAVVTGGAFSVRIVPLMGVCFMALGVAAFLSPPALGNLFLALGFGLLHVVFGIVIARRHGG